MVTQRQLDSGFCRPSALWEVPFPWTSQELRSVRARLSKSSAVWGTVSSPNGDCWEDRRYARSSTPLVVNEPGDTAVIGTVLGTGGLHGRQRFARSLSSRIANFPGFAYVAAF
jgi:hypothetical protein